MEFSFHFLMKSKSMKNLDAHLKAVAMTVMKILTEKKPFCRTLVFQLWIMKWKPVDSMSFSERSKSYPLSIRQSVGIPYEINAV